MTALIRGELIKTVTHAHAARLRGDRRGAGDRQRP